MSLTKEILSSDHVVFPFLSEDKLSYSNDHFSLHFRFIDERIIYIKSSGIVNEEYAKRSNAIMEYIEEGFRKAGIPVSFYFVNDSTEVKQYLPIASRIMQSFFEDRVASKMYLHVAVISKDQLVKLYIKTVNFLRKKKINSAHGNFQSAVNHVMDLIAGEAKELEDEQSNGDKNQELKNESDKEKIARLEKENQQLKSELDKKVEDITDKIRLISLKQNFEPFEFDATESALTPIYHALNYLNLDMQLLVRNLRKANEELAQNVIHRTHQMRSFEQRLHSVMAFSSDFICLLDRNFTIEYINPALQNYFMALYKIKLNAGEKWNEVLPEGVKKLTGKLLKEAEIEGEGRSYVSFKKIHVDFTATLLLENNEAGAYLIIGRNITEFSETLEQLKKSRENYKFITDNLNDVIWTRKKNHKINFISPSIYRQRGFTPREYIDLPLEKTMSADSAKQMNKIIEAKGYLHYSKENPLVVRGEYLKKDGSIMNGETYVYPIFEKGKLKRILGITRDIGERIKYLNKIEHQNSELESILNNTDEQIISINRNFEYVTINNVAKKVAFDNFNKEPKIGENIFNYNSVANSKKLRFAFNKVLNGENFHYIFRLVKEGRIEYLDARFRPIFLNNEVFGISMFIKNISENIYTQIALKENEQRLKRITDTALEGVWEYSSKNNSLYLSPRMKELVGFKGENDLAEFVAYIQHIMDEKDLKNIVESIQSSLINQKDIEIASKIKLEDKAEKWILVRASISYNLNNKPQTISGVIIDISRQKEQEEELKEAKIRAEEMMNLKSNFLANMSHEVRTPLNGILGVTQLLEKEGLPEEINYYLDLQKKSGFRLLDTINNILSISRLEAAQDHHELEAVELNSFIENNIEPFKIVAQQKDIGLKFNHSKEDLYINMNEHLFYQVFNNLLGNAIKFTTKGSVEITTRKIEAHAELLVKDTGIGISDEFKSKIFEAFEQESTGKNRNFEGSGLGLAIVKKYIDKLGGEIKVESTKHKGSSFTLLLPLREAENEK